MEKKVLIKRLVLILVGMVLLVAIAIGIRYLMAYNGFLDKITAHEPEMKRYSVVVLNDSEIENEKDLVDKHVGFLKTDPKVANAGQKLSEIVRVEIDYYDDIDTLVGALENSIADAIVIESDRFEMFKDEKENSLDAEDAKDTTQVEEIEMVDSDNSLNDSAVNDAVTTVGYYDEEDVGDDTIHNDEMISESFEKMRVVYTFGVELDSDDMDISNKRITAEPFVLYISGSDSRAGIRATARSDVNILAVVNPKQGKILLVSIPRDTYVQLHDTVGLKDKLTHAGVYGIDMSKRTIEDFLGIDIDYTLKVSFETVIDVVDQLDGIDIESDREMTLKSEGGGVCEYVKGKQHVNGVCALRFARERKSYETGDKHRGENQQQVIVSIIGRLSSSKDYILKIPTILDIAGDSFETTISRDNVSDFIRMQLLDGVNWKTESISVDGAGAYEPTYSMGSSLPLYVMIPYEDSMTGVKEKITEYLGD